MTALRLLHRRLRPLACLAVLSATACQNGSPLGPETSLPTDPGAAALGDPEQVVTTSLHGPVPFKGTFAATVVPDPPPPAGCEAFFRASHDGEVTHLGRFTGEGTTCGFNGQAPVFDPPFTRGAPPYFVTDFTLEQTYTVANGDTLDISGSGVFVQSLTDGSSGSRGVGVIEGGTGRFVGATGEFEAVTVNGEGSFDGWIVYDASHRAR